MQVVIIAAIIAITLFLVVKNKKKTEEKKPTKITVSDGKGKVTPIVTKPEEESRIHIGPGLVPNKPELIIEVQHCVTSIYADSRRDSVWICPVCEVENNQSDMRCCVCCQER